MTKPCAAISAILPRTKKKDGCLIWTAGHSGFGRGGGYARVYFNGSMRAAHRIMYKIFKGEIQEGFQIDHTCNNRLCVNPMHLEAVSQSENMLRAHARRRCKHERKPCIKAGSNSSKGIDANG